jgi:hypothetical protein
MRISARQKNDIVIFDLEGEIKRSDITDITLHQLVKEQLDSGKRKILLNFDATDGLNATGTKTDGNDVIFVGTKRQAQKVIESDIILQTLFCLY